MDRQIVYPGSIPLDTDILNVERSTMVAIGYLTQAVLGINVNADGLACLPTQPASMMVTVGPGSLTQYGDVDAMAFGSLPANVSAPLVKTGVNLAETPFTMVAPLQAGQAINYLIEASFLESDAGPLVLPYYNAANPGMPYSGPSNSGTSQNTQRLQSVQFQLKAGAPGAAGTQGTPSVDAGWVGLYIITVLSGQSSIISGDIVVPPDAPFIPWKLPQLSPGVSRMAAFTPASQGNWTVPAAVRNVRVRVWGGGGAGGEGFSGAGGGGAAGGYAEGFHTVGPGDVILVTVGGGGVGAGSNGGGSSFGSLTDATGGQAGANGASGLGGVGGLSGGIGSGGSFGAVGQNGGAAFLAGSTWISGRGGAAYGGSGAEPSIGSASSTTNGYSSTLPGCGGGGGVGGGLGGQGGAGLVLLEW